MTARRPALRSLLMLPAGISLLVGLDAGLGLLNAWPLVGSGRLGEIHGVLMVLGFVGTLIALERAVALGRPLGYAAPALLGAGALLMLVPLSATERVGTVLLVAGALGLCLLYVPLWRRQRDDAVLISALGAVCLLGGAVLWAGGADTAVAVPWLAGFVVLTIAGERLELARIAMPATAARDLVVLAVLVAVGVTAATLWPDVGAVLFGIGLLVLAGWLWVFDVSRRTARATGLPRFAAWCMIAGQIWLGVAGAVLLVHGSVTGGSAYDALVHAVFLGFAMSMIFAHAATILPAVTRVALPYRSVMWLPWLLLQASLVLRLWGGDALGSEPARRIGGLGNAVALLLFLVVAVGSAAVGARERRDRTPAGVTP